MKILKINSSSNKLTSVSRAFTEKVITHLLKSNKDAEVIERDAAYSDIPFVDEGILSALFVVGERDKDQIKALEFSDELVNEVFSADVIVVGAPIYNFGIPASLKAYFDLIARVGVTFKYTETGPVGLLENKKVFAVISSGGTEVGSHFDYSSGYIKLFFSLIGITDVTIIPVDQLLFKGEVNMQKAEELIATL